MAGKGSARGHKKGRGKASARGKDWARSKGYANEFAKGLTDEDLDALEVVEDNTDEVIERIGIAIGRALEAIGIEAEGDAARLCPVDTGRLRNSITHAVMEDPDGPAVYIGTNVEYAEAVHNGTGPRDGKPFLTDAVNQNAGKYGRMFREAMGGR